MADRLRIPLSVTDIHNHLVPGVDDGAASVDEAIDALIRLHREGVNHLVTTPHIVLPRLATDLAVERELDIQARAFDRLEFTCHGRDDVPNVALGQEIWAPTATEAMRIAKHSRLRLGHLDYVLVEFGFNLEGDHLDVVAATLDSGRRMVIAHPERYSYRPGTDPLELAARWRDAGALLQVNVGSLTGHYRDHRPASQDLAWALIDTGLADLLSTDHHGPRREGVSPREAYDALVARGRGPEARRLFETTPAAIAGVRVDTPSIEFPTFAGAFATPRQSRHSSAVPAA